MLSIFASIKYYRLVKRKDGLDLVLLLSFENCVEEFPCAFFVVFMLTLHFLQYNLDSQRP